MTQTVHAQNSEPGGSDTMWCQFVRWHSPHPTALTSITVCDLLETFAPFQGIHSPIIHAQCTVAASLPCVHDALTYT